MKLLAFDSSLCKKSVCCLGHVWHSWNFHSHSIGLWDVLCILWQRPALWTIHLSGQLHLIALLFQQIQTQIWCHCLSLQFVGGWYNKRRKDNWIGHILHRHCLLKHVVEEKMEERMKVTGRCARRCKKFKEEALNHTLWGTVYGRGCGPVITQTMEWILRVVANWLIA